MRLVRIIGVLGEITAPMSQSIHIHLTVTDLADSTTIATSIARPGMATTTGRHRAQRTTTRLISIITQLRLFVIEITSTSSEGTTTCIELGTGIGSGYRERHVRQSLQNGLVSALTLRVCGVLRSEEHTSELQSH